MRKCACDWVLMLFDWKCIEIGWKDGIYSCVWGLDFARNVVGSVPAGDLKREYQEDVNEEVCVI